MPLKKVNISNTYKATENNTHIRGKTKENISNNSNKQIVREEMNQNFHIQKPRYSIKDIILSEDIKEQLKDVIYSKKYKQKVFDDWGLSTVLLGDTNRLAVNLYGPPGTGKTMAAHVIASELNRELLCVNYAEIESKYVGETAKNLEKVFRFASDKNLIIFFDEADAMLSKRVSNMNSSTDVSVNQTRSVLLMLMNEYKDIIIFTTNFINNFDEAFMRRIQFHIKFQLPCEDVRRILWDKYIPKKMPNTANINELAKKYEGISGSDISNAVRIAAFKAARLNEEYVDNKYFHESINSILNSKMENKSTTNQIITEKFVSEEYVKSQINIEGNK